MTKTIRDIQPDTQPEPADWSVFQPVPWEQLPDLGLYMDQVITYVERLCQPLYVQEKFLTPAMVNNYVKSGLIARPNGKKYNRALLAQLIMICTLKQALSQDEMKKLLAPGASSDAKTGSTTDLDRHVETQYREFCTTQTAVWNLVLTRRAQSSPMHSALEAAASKILCGEKIEQLTQGA
ncbi:MAG: DUF1836 domain-containing protein [Eubacteriales bacterium]|nr:DUF1836 domain-containing protein [Eubacteriales bacterium]